MLQMLAAAWRTRRVLLIGGRDDVLVPLEAWLTMLGALPVCLPQDAPPETLYRAMTRERVCAVIVASPPAGNTLLDEIRESGVPLTLLCAPGDGQDAALGALIFGAHRLLDGDAGLYDCSQCPP